jgi:hypothetical protein
MDVLGSRFIGTSGGNSGLQAGEEAGALRSRAECSSPLTSFANRAHTMNR